MTDHVINGSSSGLNPEESQASKQRKPSEFNTPKFQMAPAPHMEIQNIESVIKMTQTNDQPLLNLQLPKLNFPPD